MHDSNAIAAMSGSEFTEQVLDPLTRSQLESLLRFLHGYTPQSMARALQALDDGMIGGGSPKAAPEAENTALRALVAAIAELGVTPESIDQRLAARIIRDICRDVDKYPALLPELAGDLRSRLTSTITYPAQGTARPAGDGEPICGALRHDGDTDLACNSQPGHDGPDHVAWAADGSEITRWPAGAGASGGVMFGPFSDTAASMA